jgi:alkylation response protein AidB-like acyl-CoA dehydrogenase
VHFGSEEQKQRFLPGILSGEDIWCQGYSEPSAGSDLANVQTRAELKGDEWVLNGQKVWTSGAAWSDWCFVVCRTDASAQPKHRGLSYILCPMDQPGVEIRPIVQMTGDAEFSEVFFNDAKAAKDDLVGGVNGGWKVAMGTLAFERGASTLGQQMSFQNELDEIIAIAKANGMAKDPIMRQRIADAWIGLRLQRYIALRTLSVESGAEVGREGMITKLFWASWHRDLGKLAMDVLGAQAEIGGAGGGTEAGAAETPAGAEPAAYPLSKLQRMYLFTRSDTIYAGSNQIQRNIISERALGMPKEPRPS